MADSLPGVDNLEGNGRKKILVIGKTGTGKSSLCNVLCGLKHNAKMFPVSAKANSCTQRTFFCETFFNNNMERPISLIDTIGFDDPDKDDDAKIIGELVTRLKHGCDHVSLFIIAVNGQNPRLDGSLLGMIKIFEGMFGPDFWKQVVVLFTRMTMDEKSKRRRADTTERTDDQQAKEYMAEVAKRFSKSHGVGYVFLDACYDPEDQEEKKCFDSAIEELHVRLEKAENLPTSKVQEVETKTKALQNEIARREKEKEEAEKQLKEMAKKQAESAQKVADLQMQIREAELDGEREKANLLREQLKEERGRQKAENEELKKELKRLKEYIENSGFSFNKVIAGIGDAGAAVAKAGATANQGFKDAANAILKRINL